jgi:hypothetical protein
MSSVTVSQLQPHTITNEIGKNRNVLDRYPIKQREIKIIIKLLMILWISLRRAENRKDL